MGRHAGATALIDGLGIQSLMPDDTGGTVAMAALCPDRRRICAVSAGCPKANPRGIKLRISNQPPIGWCILDKIFQMGRSI